MYVTKLELMKNACLKYVYKTFIGSKPQNLWIDKPT